MKKITLLIALLVAYGTQAQSNFEELKSEFSVFRQAGDQDGALSTAKRMHRLALQEQGDTSYWYALSARYIGNPFYSQENVDSCLFYWEKSAKLFSEYHPDHADYATSLNNLGVLYSDLGDYAKAEEYHLQSLAIRKKVLGEEHADYANSLYNLGNLYRDLGDYAKAEEYCLQSLAIEKKVLGEEHADYAGSLNNLGLLYYYLGDYAKAEEYYLQSLAIYKKVLGEEHPDYALSLNWLGWFYREKGEFKTSIEFYEKALALNKKLFGEQNAAYASGLYYLGEVYSEQYDFVKSEEYYSKALAIMKLVLGEDHEDYATSLFSLGQLHRLHGNYTKSEEYLLQALSKYQNLFGEEHEDYSMCLQECGNLYADLGNYQKAEEYYLRALTVYINIFGVGSFEHAITLQNLGLNNYYLGKYEESEECIVKALSFYDELFNEEGEYHADCLNNLGLLYMVLGDFPNALKHFKQSSLIYKSVLGEESDAYAASLNNIAILYKDSKDYVNSEKYNLEALGIRKNLFGEKHLDYIMGLSNLGALYHDKGDFTNAALLYEQSLNVLEEVESESVFYALTLENLGVLQSDIGDFQKAQKNISRSYALFQKLLGEHHPDFLLSQINLAQLYFKQGDFGQSLKLFQEVYKKRSDAVIADFEWMSEALKEAYWSDRGDFFSGLAAYAHDAGELQGSFSALAYDATLFRKSRLLESTIDEQDYEANREKLKTAYDVQRRTLKKMHSEGGYDPQAHDILAARVDSLDKALQQSWPEYAALKRNLSINWQQVQRGLSDKEVAIEFVRFYHAKDSLSRYGALVIDARCSSPTYVPLCSEDDLEKIMSEKALYESGRDFYDLLWAPLEPSLQGVDIVYYAADGLLNQIPFHSIILSRKGEPITYAMDRYELHKLTSTRYLALELKAAAQQPPAHSIAMLGGMDYDYLPGQSKSRRKGSGNKAKERSSQYSGQPLMYLEGTMKEVQESAKQLKRQKTEYDVTTYTGVEAKEELLYEIDSIGVPGILHIATHGYAFPEMDFSDTTISEHSLRYVYRYSPYPMVRSGLIMTSGNWKWTGSDTLKTINPANEDGILTAMEVADLPLDECKLVVLSACESALGHIDEEEGTLGIVRGLKLAGVEQVMATLWSINDKKASEFMLAYYEHLAQNNNTIKAYQETQLLMRNKYPTNPQYWAGFVLMR